jgi:cell wall-associated NlpC family hydrolase
MLMQSRAPSGIPANRIAALAALLCAAVALSTGTATAEPRLDPPVDRSTATARQTTQAEAGLTAKSTPSAKPVKPGQNGSPVRAGGPSKPAQSGKTTQAGKKTKSVRPAASLNAADLDPASFAPQPGDSAATTAARSKLARVAADYGMTAQRYNQASDALAAVNSQLKLAQAAETDAAATASAVHAQLVKFVASAYKTSVPLHGITVLLTREPDAILDTLGLMSEMGRSVAGKSTIATNADLALVRAKARVAGLVAQASAAKTIAASAVSAATTALTRAHAIVAEAHLNDLRTAAIAAELAAARSAAKAGADASSAANDSAGAAESLQGQALATGAAKPADFVGARSATAAIAIAVRAMIQQAAGRRPAPPVAGALRAPTSVASPSATAASPRSGAAKSGTGLDPTWTTAPPGVLSFAVAGPSAVVDERHVMGRTPALGGNLDSGRGGRSGSAYALRPFEKDPIDTPPNSGVGRVGAAPLLPANGTTVHPIIPTYPKGYNPLRAEVAIDAALAQLGSPYVWAAAGPTTFDCSGLTQFAWAKAGVSLGHFTGTQAMQGVRVTADELLPGDLVLFGANLHHVGMYLGAGYMIDAPHTGAYVRIEKIAPFGDASLAIRP